MVDQQTENVENASPPSFIGLQYYTEAQSDFFFGRDEEIGALTTLIKSNTLTIVFGKSGTGKTSLLNAGVFPKLRKDYCLPFRIRLEFKEDSPDLLTQVKNVLREEIDKYGFKVENYPSTETLWEYFHKENLWRSLTPVLVFDQFEEIFTLSKKNSSFARQLHNFWEELSDLIENEIPDKLSDLFLNHREQITYNYKRQPVKVVFAFREEFLPEFESIPTNIPSLKYSRFRLMPMNENQAYDVITKTWKEKIEPEQAKKIITYFTADEKVTYISEIEPSLLSQVCFYLDKERIAQGKNKITSQFLETFPKETILRSIYDEVLTESYDAVGRPAEPSKKGASDNPLKVFVEDKLITDEGYRTKYALTEYDENLRPGIEVLKDKYFVRDDGKAVELTHDVLAPIIKADRETRRKQIARREANRKALRRAIIASVVVALLGLAFLGYSLYERHQVQEDISDLEFLKAQTQFSLDSTQSLLDGTASKLKGEQGGSGEARVDDTRETSPADSAALDSLNREIASLNTTISDLSNQKLSLNNSLELLNVQVQELQDRVGIAESDNKDLKAINVNLQAQIATDQESIAKWRRMFEELKRDFDAYRLLYPKTFPESAAGNGNSPTARERSDTNSLKLKLYYLLPNKKRTPAQRIFGVYIIPDVPENRTIIRDASYYELHCNEPALQNAKGYRTAEYRNGTYIFPDLPKGKYFIKICTYYGGYYDYTKTKIGTDSLTLNAAPAIR